MPFYTFGSAGQWLCKLYESVHIDTMDAGELLDIVEARRRELGLTQADVARRAGRKSSTGTALIQNVKRGKSPTLQNISAICDALGLELYIGPSRAATDAPPEPADPSLYVPVPLYAARLSAGPGAENDDAPPARPIAFRDDWLRRLGVSARHARLVTVSGDSMAPTLCDRDLVLIDAGRAQLRPGRIYAFNDITGDTRVKRIERLASEGLALRSDNPEWPLELRAPDEADRIAILGEVVWFARSLAALVHP